MESQDLLTTPHPDTQTVALQVEVRLLRAYLVATLAATVISTFCFDVFLYRVDRGTRAQLPQARELRGALEKEAIQLTGILNQVAAFGTTHQDVAMVLSKYGVTVVPPQAILQPPTTQTAPPTKPAAAQPKK